MRTLLLASLVLFACTACASQTHREPGFDDDDTAAATETDEHADEGHGIGHRLLFYIPNRIFDVFDMVRARVRVGLGFGVSVRATELASVTAAAYSTAWVGIHGPRGKPSIPWPVGLEILAGAGVSVVQAEADADLGPDYGFFEFGLGLQVAIIGFDVGVDPKEILDLALGLVTIDISDDDY